MPTPTPSPPSAPRSSESACCADTWSKLGAMGDISMPERSDEAPANGTVSHTTPPPPSPLLPMPPMPPTPTPPLPLFTPPPP
eukprot:67282-Pleurochrysis_carterae.AAC.1